MGDVRFTEHYAQVKDAADTATAIREMADEAIISALAATSREEDAYLANVIATEAMNRARRWRTVYRNVGEGVIIVDPQGVIVSDNPAAARLFRTTRGGLVGRSIQAFVDPSSPLSRSIDQLLKNAADISVTECETRRCDETTFPADVTGSAIYHGDSVDGAVLVIRDVSGRVESTRRLRESAQRYRSLFEHNVDLVLTLDPNGHFLAVNRAAATVLGYSPEDLVGEYFIDYIQESTRSQAEEAFRYALAGEGRTSVCQFRRKDGTVAIMQVNCIPVVVDGEVVGVHGILRDLTEEEEKAALDAARESAVRHQQQVLANLASLPGLVRGDFPGALAAACGAAAKALDVASVSFWTIDEARGRLRCQFRYRDGMDQADGSGVRELRLDPTYVAELRQSRVISAGDAVHDERTRWLADEYLRPEGIASVLDVPVRVEGGLVGVIWHEHIGTPREWTPDELTFAAAIGDMIAIARSTHDRAAAEEQARVARERLDAILSEADMLVFAVDSKGIIAYAEGRSLRNYGFDPEKLTGRSIFEVFPDGPGVAKIRTALSEGIPTSVEHEHDGAWFESRYNPTFDAQGNVTGVVGVSHNVTARVKAEAALLESQARYRRLAEATNELIVIHHNGRILEANDAFLRESGYLLDEVIGRSVLDFTPPEERERIAMLVGSGRDALFEGVGLRKDGTTFPAELAARKVMVEGEPARVVSIRNLTREKETQAEIARHRDHLEELVEERTSELRRVSAQLARILEAAGEGIAGLDASGRVTFMNEAGATMLGTEPGEIVGRDFHRFVHASHSCSQETCLLLAAIERGERQHDDGGFFSRGQNGDLAVSFTISPIFRNRTVTGAAVVFEDVTERRRARARIDTLHAELQGRVRELATANEELEAFAYTVSHDLRAPLRAIDVIGEALIEDYGPRLDAEGLRLAGQLRGQTTRLRRLIEDILELSRVGQGEIHPARVDASRIAREVIETLRKGEPGRKIVVNIEEGLEICADPSLLRVALENLIENAWKYTAGQPEGLIEVTRAEADDQTFAIAVRDNGVGFDMSQLGRLFLPFQRLGSAMSFEGSGVGLATVARIARRHGGNVKAEGALGEGATFTLTLPDVCG